MRLTAPAANLLRRFKGENPLFLHLLVELDCVEIEPVWPSENTHRNENSLKNDGSRSGSTMGPPAATISEQSRMPFEPSEKKTYSR